MSLEAEQTGRAAMEKTMNERDHDFYTILRHILENPEKFVLLDTETTGIGAADQVIELGILDLKGAVLLDTLVRPTCRISPEAMAVNGITEAMVADAPDWKAVWAQAEPLLKGKRILAYNAAFDVRMLKQTCRIHGLKEPYIRSQCLMEAAANWLGYRPKLQYFAGGIQSHRAVEDCRILLDNLILRNYTNLSRILNDEE